MAEPEPADRSPRVPTAPGPALGLTLTLTMGLLAAAGCTQAPAPRVLPETPSASAPESASGAPDGPNADELSEAAETEGSGEVGEDQQADDPSVIVIESGATGRRGKTTLWEAAVAARKARESARPPVASVTNENLHEYQDAELTFAEPTREPGAGAAEEDAPTEDAGEDTEPEESEEPTAEEQGEKYWRNMVLDIRLRMRAAVDEIEELEAEVASLRRSFYAEDDPYIRDGRIKPAWDRAIGRLATTRRRVASLRQELAEALEDGRRAGALAGWLREGIELEPSFEEQRSAAGETDAGGLSIHESRELDTVEPDEPPNTHPEEPPP